MKLLNVEIQIIKASSEDKQEMLVAGVESEISNEHSVESLFVEGSSFMWKDIDEKGIAPASVIERKSRPMREGKEGQFDRIDGNGKELKSMKPKKKQWLVMVESIFLLHRRKVYESQKINIKVTLIQ